MCLFCRRHISHYSNKKCLRQKFDALVVTLFDVDVLKSQSCLFEFVLNFLPGFEVLLLCITVDNCWHRDGITGWCIS